MVITPSSLLLPPFYQERQARLEEDMYDEDLDYQYESYQDGASSARSFQAERSAVAKAQRAAFAQNKAGKKASS